MVLYVLVCVRFYLFDGADYASQQTLIKIAVCMILMLSNVNHSVLGVRHTSLSFNTGHLKVPKHHVYINVTFARMVERFWQGSDNRKSILLP